MKTLVAFPSGPVVFKPPASEAELQPAADRPVGAPAPVDSEFRAWLAELL